MVIYKVLFSRMAQKDAIKLKEAGLKTKTDELIELLKVNPYAMHPPCEKLMGDLSLYWSRRINIQHRLVYRIDRESQEIFILRMWGHYE